jgi:DNA-binding beta-propeller fold protein YncE
MRLGDIWATVTMGACALFSISCSVEKAAPEPEVKEFVPGTIAIRFKWPTHIAFGPGDLQIITDLKNSRFVFRDGPAEPFRVSPIPLKQPHSLVYNPRDKLYYANDTDNHRIIAFADLESETITAETKNIAGVTLNRPHDVVIDPATGWIYALNPRSGHVFRFTAVGENESALQVPVDGYARSLTFVNDTLYVIGSAKGRVVEIVDWDTKQFKIHDSYDPTGKDGPAGSWETTGLVLNDVEYFSGYWYATSYFTEAYADGTDADRNKFIRFKTFEDFTKGNWTDLSDLLPRGLVPYYLTVHEDRLYVAVFNHEEPGNGDAIFRIMNPDLSG